MANRVAFVLANTRHGMMILNRLDYQKVGDEEAYGVGIELLEQGEYNPTETLRSLQALEKHRQYYGDGVVAMDVGANIGAYTLSWGQFMRGWGSVIAIDAQEMIFYALGGNIALNNLFNVQALNVAVGAKEEIIEIPTLNYQIPSSFGSFELKYRGHTPNANMPATEALGQDLNYAENLTRVPMITIDSMNLNRLDYMKIDIEGMEQEAFEGAKETLKRCTPIIHAEHHKSDKVLMKAFLEDLGYQVWEERYNYFAVHKDDKILKDIQEVKSESKE